MKNKTISLASVIIFLIGVYIAFMLIGVSLMTQSAVASNITNQTVIARVNISNTEPNLNDVTIESPLDSDGNIDLTAGGTTTVICNGSFSDQNGFDDIEGVNATLFFNSVGSNAADDNNTHYTNRSCLSSGATCTQITGEQNNGTCLCQFVVQYFANPGNWVCNMTINDSGSLVAATSSELTNLNEILGIGVETASLNFGNLSVSQTSAPIRENITNFGNIPINVTVRGFGGDNETIGENLSMICDSAANSLANITFGNMKFDTKNETAFDSMVNITNQTRKINVTIPQRLTDNSYGNSSNSTFWRLKIPLGAAGVCNGTIIFGAIDAIN